MSKKANKENRCSRSIFENEIEKLKKDPSVSDMGRFHQHKGNTKLAHVENVADISFKKFHYPWCDSVKKMSDKNKKESTESREKLINDGYEPCGNCNP